MNKKYRFIIDPGHGWLEVPLKEVLALGLNVSSYSYRNGQFAYLEEDCDAPLFANAVEKLGGKVEIESVYEENTPIRNYRCY